MPSPELPPRATEVVNTAETSAETSREILAHRGETTLEARAYAEEEAKKARIAEIKREIAAEKAKLAQIEARLAELPTSTGDGGAKEPPIETPPVETPPPIEGMPGPILSPDPTSTTSETGTSASETGAETSEDDPDVTETIEKAKKKSGLKKILTAATAVIVAGAIGLGLWGIFGHKDKTETPSQPTKAVETLDEHEKIGIQDGYGEKGMWLSEHKKGPYNFANAAEVAEVCNNDECEMIKYTADNQVESYADYLANLPEELQPEGFKGLSIIETERKLESLSDEDYEGLQKTFNETIDGAFTRRVTLNGAYDNAYMKKIDASGEVVHDNMQLVRCTTNENNLEVTEFYWLDAEGNEIGSMKVKMSPVYNESGEIIGFEGCEQVVNELGKPIYNELPEIETPEEETPPDITPTPTPTPNPNPTPTPTPTPTPNPNPTPTPTPGSTYRPTPTPTENVAPKDVDNMTRIDEAIHEDIADDINSDEIRIEKTPAATVEETPLTPRPTGDDFEGTAPTIVENEAAAEAETIIQSDESENAPASATVISPENNYSENRGGANAGNAAPNPVEANDSAQAVADRNETPVSEAPSGGQELSSILSDLGIN